MITTGMLKIKLPNSLLLCLAMLSSMQLEAQILFGPKLGYQATSIRYATLYDGPDYSEGFRFSTQFGAIYQFAISPKLAFYSELFYARRDKSERTSDSNTLMRIHRQKNHMLEMPLMMRLIMPLKKSPRSPRFYVNAGPQVAYWLAGSSDLSHLENYGSSTVLRRDYDIVFSPAEDRNVLYAEDANRLQFGLSAGGGLLIPINRKKHLLQIDLRYTYGTTFMGSDLALPFGQSGVEENLAFGHSIIGVSVAYGFYTNIWEMRKGKSIRRK
jgi:hypothetical protein